MTKYIEYFQVEAKCLLKDFKKNLPEAKSRCEKYFSNRDSLSLMNTQHVIAKEYGFDSWNDLIKQESHKLAEALIVTKNKTLKNPFKLWWGGCFTTGYEQKFLPLNKPEDYKLEYDAKEKTFIRRDFKNDVVNYKSFEHLDLSEYDLSGLNPLFVRYSEDTKWPEDKSMLPVGFNPKEFLETRKNPGLGIKNLHKQGIKGNGRNIAIIDSIRLFNHIEYHNSLKGYEEIGIDASSYGGGSNGGFVSAFVGKTCGIAPLANAYYYAVDEQRTKENPRGSLINYAEAIKKVCELHKKLISEGKNGIDVIHIQGGLTSEVFQNYEGYEETVNAKKDAEQLGIWCNDYNKFIQNEILREERVYCKLDGDLDNPNDYMLTEYSPLHKVPSSKKELFANSLCFPCGAKTVALGVKMDEYAFEHCAGPYAKVFASSLYLLAKSVKETITPYEFFYTCLKTGVFKEGVGTIVNPIELIESLK